MSEIQWAALTGFILGALVGASIMTIINLRYVRGIIVTALRNELAGDHE